MQREQSIFLSHVGTWPKEGCKDLFAEQHKFEAAVCLYRQRHADVHLARVAWRGGFDNSHCVGDRPVNGLNSSSSSSSNESEYMKYKCISIIRKRGEIERRRNIACRLLSVSLCLSISAN